MSGASAGAESIREAAYEAVRARGLVFDDEAQRAFEAALERADRAVASEPDRLAEAARNLDDLLDGIQSAAQTVRLADGSTMRTVTGTALALGFRRKCPKWPYC